MTRRSRLRLRTEVLLAFLGLATGAAAAEPVRGLLFRADTSAQAGYLYHRIAEDGGTAYETGAAAVGPNLNLNLGYAPSHLVRLGLDLGADFANRVGDGHQGVPNGEIDGWQRWSVGPTVGFRFGPRAPLELEVRLAFAQSKVYGSQTWPTGGTGSEPAYVFGSTAYGVSQGIRLIYRPLGADSAFGLHTGYSGSFGYAQTNHPNGYSTSETVFGGAWLFGMSLGI